MILDFETLKEQADFEALMDELVNVLNKYKIQLGVLATCSLLIGRAQEGGLSQEKFLEDCDRVWKKYEERNKLSLNNPPKNAS